MVVMAMDLRAQLAAKEAENERLLAEVARLTVEIERMGAELALLRAAGEQANARVAELVETVAKLNDRVAELLAIAKRKKRNDKEKSAAEPPPPPGLTDEQRRAFDERPKPPPEPAPEPKSKTKQKPTGRKPIPEHIPADTTRSVPGCCEHCNSTRLQQESEIVETKLDIAAHCRGALGLRRIASSRRASSAGNCAHDPLEA